MKRLLAILFVSLVPLWSSHSLFAGESAQHEPATLKWLGTAGWEIQYGGQRGPSPVKCQESPRLE